MVNNINIPNKQSGEQFTADEFNLLLNGVNSAITEFNTNLVSVEKIEWVEGETKPEIVADVILGTISEGETKYVQIVKVGEQNVAILHSPNNTILSTFNKKIPINFQIILNPIYCEIIGNELYILSTIYYDEDITVSIFKVSNDQVTEINQLEYNTYYGSSLTIISNKILLIDNKISKIIAIDKITELHDLSLESKFDSYTSIDYKELILTDLVSTDNFLYVTYFAYTDETQTSGTVQIHKFDSNFDFISSIEIIQSISVSISRTFIKDNYLYVSYRVSGSAQFLRINLDTDIIDPDYGQQNLFSGLANVISVFEDNSIIIRQHELYTIISNDGRSISFDIGLDYWNDGKFIVLEQSFKSKQYKYGTIIDQANGTMVSCTLDSSGTITERPSIPISNYGILLAFVQLETLNYAFIVEGDIGESFEPIEGYIYRVDENLDPNIDIDIEVDYYKNVDNHIDGNTNRVFTATEKNKLSTIEDGAEVNVNADWNSSSGDSQILNKPALGTAASINYWTGTQIEYDANTVKNGVAAQTADLATIIG